MKIINNDDRYKLYWRVFNPSDGLCWVGLEEGFLDQGAGESTIYNHPRGKMKVEIRYNNLQGPPVLTAGPVYSNNTQFTFTNNRIEIDNYSS